MKATCWLNVQSPFGAFDAECGDWVFMSVPPGEALCPSPRLERLHLMARADMAVDGGEFSGAFWADREELEASTVPSGNWGRCEGEGTGEGCRSWPASLVWTPFSAVRDEAHLRSVATHERLHIEYAMRGEREQARRAYSQLANWAEDCAAARGWKRSGRLVPEVNPEVRRFLDVPAQDVAINAAFAKKPGGKK